jgi:hypothetical protein
LSDFYIYGIFDGADKGGFVLCGFDDKGNLSRTRMYGEGYPYLFQESMPRPRTFFCDSKRGSVWLSNGQTIRELHGSLGPSNYGFWFIPWLDLTGAFNALAPGPDPFMYTLYNSDNLPEGLGSDRAGFSMLTARYVPWTESGGIIWDTEFQIPLFNTSFNGTSHMVTTKSLVYCPETGPVVLGQIFNGQPEWAPMPKIPSDLGQSLRGLTDLFATQFDPRNGSIVATSVFGYGKAANRMRGAMCYSTGLGVGRIAVLANEGESDIGSTIRLFILDGVTLRPVKSPAELKVSPCTCVVSGLLRRCQSALRRCQSARRLLYSGNWKR